METLMRRRQIEYNQDGETGIGYWRVCVTEE